MESPARSKNNSGGQDRNQPIRCFESQIEGQPVDHGQQHHHGSQHRSHNHPSLPGRRVGVFDAEVIGNTGGVASGGHCGPQFGIDNGLITGHRSPAGGVVDPGFDDAMDRGQAALYL